MVSTHQSLLFVRIIAIMIAIVLSFYICKFGGLNCVICVIAGTIVVTALGFVNYLFGSEVYGLALFSFGAPFLLCFIIGTISIFFIRKLLKKDDKGHLCEKNIIFKLFKNIFFIFGILLNGLWLILGVFSFTAFFSHNLPITVGQIIVVCIYFCLLSAADILFPFVLLNKNVFFEKFKILLSIVCVVWFASCVVCTLEFFIDDIKLLYFFDAIQLDVLYLSFLKIPTLGMEFMVLGNLSNLIGLLLQRKKSLHI